MKLQLLAISFYRKEAHMYPSKPASLFASHARNWQTTFECSSDFKVGAYQLREGEPVKVVSDGDGLFSVYVEWGDGAIGRLNAHDINKLAGHEVVA
jgi:hypothetical protein